jgi:drug/metabolite transporter (DMT)-like permease
VTAVVLAIVIVGERPGGLALLGLGLILGGLALLIRAELASGCN